MSEPIEVTEYTDAMCSWAWGAEPKLRLLRWRFGPQITSWRLVMGHLVEDEFMPERDREAQAAKLQEYWKVVCDQTGMPRPLPLKRSTAGSRASGLVVKAAQRQSNTAAEAIVRRLREASFIAGEPPDTVERCLHAIRGLDGIGHEALAAAVDDPETAAAYEQDRDETRQPNDYVLTLDGDQPGIGRARPARDGRMRFVFPTLVMRSARGERTVPGWVDYAEYERALLELGAEADERATSRPTPEQALNLWPCLALHELRFLSGPDAAPPSDAVASDAPGGAVLRTKSEAVAVGLVD